MMKKFLSLVLIASLAGSFISAQANSVHKTISTSSFYEKWLKTSNNSTARQDQNPSYGDLLKSFLPSPFTIAAGLATTALGVGIAYWLKTASISCTKEEAQKYLNILKSWHNDQGNFSQDTIVEAVQSTGIRYSKEELQKDIQAEQTTKNFRKIKKAIAKLDTFINRKTYLISSAVSFAGCIGVFWYALTQALNKKVMNTYFRSRNQI